MRKLQVLVVADDSQVGHWVQTNVAALRNDCSTELDTMATFERRLASTRMGDFNILIAVLDFGADAAANSMEWLEHVQGIPDTPPLLVLAEHGDELAAVGAMHRGVADYLPRRQLTASLLAAAIDHGLATRHGPAVHRPASMQNPLKVPRNLIPRYMLLDTLGESACATIYLALSDGLDRHVALKVSRITDSEEAQFSREIEAVGGLRHPGVVDIYDYGLHDGREFIAMEYFPCGDLRARLMHPLSEFEALGYLHLIASALSAVHRHGMVHGDLKPSNIMLRDDGQTVLIDFGISSQIGHNMPDATSGVLRGSPFYMSPEQAQGLALDARSDLYSLGVIFYEMLVGVRPYLGGTAIELLQQHVSAPVPELPPTLSQYQPLLEVMMAKPRAARFASADALIDRISSTFGNALCLHSPEAEEANLS